MDGSDGQKVRREVRNQLWGRAETTGKKIKCRKERLEDEVRKKEEKDTEDELSVRFSLKCFNRLVQMCCREIPDYSSYVLFLHYTL